MEDLIADLKNAAIVRGITGGVYTVLSVIAFAMSYFWPGIFILVAAVVSFAYSIYTMNSLKKLSRPSTFEGSTNFQ